VGNHWVKFYEDDAELITPLERFVRGSLDRQDGIIVVATPEHRRAMNSRLESCLDQARERGNYRELDAAEALYAFSTGSALSETLFSNRVSAEIDIVRRASQSGEVRVFGEVVGVLTASGRFDDAIELEHFWNRLMTRETLALFCAYPLAHFPSALHRVELESICLTHTHVETRTPRPRWSESHQAATEMAILEQQARAAQLEARKRATLEEELAQRKYELAQARRLEAIALLGAGIAHDFNNFLTVIDSATDYLLDTYLPADEQRGAVLDIKAASERAAALSARLLALTGAKHSAQHSVDPNELVRSLSRLFRRVVKNHADLSVELDETLGCIRVDSGQLEQMLLNLVVNARDALQTQGQIVLRTRRRILRHNSADPHGMPHGTYVSIEVADNGSGISDAARDQVFEPFFTTKPKGFGLGLSTVQMLVRQNGGHISVTTVPGQGTTFCLAFPEFARPAQSSYN
jgi:signal transduction histidine kinase